MEDLRIKLDKPRKLSAEELQWMEKLLSVDFLGRDILVEQMSQCEVISFCGCGCKTIDLAVNKELPKYPYDVRVPVEMINDELEIPVIFALHVVKGYISELEVYRADSEAILSPINELSECKITKNI